MIKPVTLLSLQLALGSLVLSPLVAADERFKIGEQKSKTCMTCHGRQWYLQHRVLPESSWAKDGLPHYIVKGLSNQRTKRRLGGINAATS